MDVITYLYHFIVTLVVVYIVFILIGAIGSLMADKPSAKKRIYLLVFCCAISYFILNWKETQEENREYELNKIIQEYESEIEDAYDSGYYDGYSDGHKDGANGF